MSAREKYPHAAKTVATTSPDGALFARLSEVGSISAYPRNTVLQTEGAHIDTVYFILEGRLKVFVGEDGRQEVRVDTLSPGDCFGLAALDS